MRPILSTLLTLAASSGFAVCAFAAPQLEITDEGLPLQEIRPLDRRDWVLTLEGKWNQDAIRGKTYYINVFLPDGATYSHHVLSDQLFGLGEVRCVIQGYQLVRHGAEQGGKLLIVASVSQPVASLTDPHVVSNIFEVDWPLNRPISMRLVRTKHSPAPPDAFPVREEMPRAEDRPFRAPEPIPLPPEKNG